MRRNLTFLIVLIMAFFMMGMGDIGGDTNNNIPLPNKDFKAIITDVNKVETDCSFVSINGKDYLKGKRGAASVTIPFENIASMKVKPVGDEKEVKAEVALHDGSTINLRVDCNCDVYGKTAFGTIQIKMYDISEIEFTTKEK